jgi:exonuclease VII small subunit
MTWYDKKQNKTTTIIKKYNIGTLQMFISPEILSMTSKERKKIDKIYYKREYTETPSELQQSQKEYEKGLALKNKQKEQKEQKENDLKKLVANADANADAATIPSRQVAPALPAIPLPPQPAVAAAAANNLQKKKEPMLGGAFSDYDFNDSRDRLYDRDRGRTDMNRGIGTGTVIGTGQGTGTVTGTSNILTRVLPDSEPFIASLVKFNNSGFPNNTTVKSRVDTFFNINLFKAFLKKLGEPIKLYSNENQLVSVDDIDALNRDKEQKKGDNTNSKNKVYETDQQTNGNFITNWYPSQEQKTLIGSVYAFIYNRPTEQENKQQIEMGKRVSSASMLMIKEGDNYRLIGGPVDNRVKINYGFNSPTTVATDKYNSVTSDTTVESQINSDYRRVTGQSYLPQSVSNTARRFIYEPQSSFVPNTDAKSDIKDLKSVIYSRQVTSSQIESIIESSRASSTDIVKVPINTLFNILNGKIETLQLKIDLSPQTKTVLKFLFRILEKQNLLSNISGQQKKKAGEIYENRVTKLREKLSESSLNELDSIIIHNIRFILDILFSSKTAFKYKDIEYIIDYIEWNGTFKQLNKVLENYKVAYYIELELFIEKLEKGKLPIDRDGTLFSSCAVRGAQLKNYWKRNFLEQNWSRIGRQIKKSIKLTKTPSITDILPGFIKKALDIGSNQVMSPLSAGVNQISFVQYCFLGQEQLVEQFKNIDNSFAGVSWKNENSWNKRKEILFAAMDSCSSDIYCFQNVQCSIEAYRKILSSLTDEEKITLEDVTTNKVQRDRIKLYRNIINQLLEDVGDPLNLVAQIYERYKNEYTFVYFFEQEFSGIEMIIGKNKTAVGHLTMFKSDKFELKDEFDIRIAPFIRKNKGKFGNVTALDPIYDNTSFGTITYCKFKGNKHIKLSDIPGQTIFVSKPLSPTSTLSPEVQTQSNVPGMPGYVGTIKVSEDDATPDEHPTKESVDEIKDYEEEPSIDPSIPSVTTSTAPTTAPTTTPDTTPTPATGASNSKSSQKGGDGEWYSRDTSEQTGFLSGLFGSTDASKQSKVKAEAEPCKKYMNPNYIPGGQIFGIINIKLETAETLKQIESKQVKSDTTDRKITKQLLEVLLIAAFVSKFRSRYYLSSSTDVNPYFIAGDFNFDIPSNEEIGKGTIKNIYSKAPALDLLLTRSNNTFKPENYPLLKEYATEILDFIYQKCKIVTYLYGGKGKNGRLRLIGYTNSQTLSNMFGNKYSLIDPSRVNKSQLIFTTGKLLLCPKEEMNKIVNSDSPEGLPVFPNNSNPSNSDAIGGVFEFDTEYIKKIIQKEENNVIFPLIYDYFTDCPY